MTGKLYKALKIALCFIIVFCSLISGPVVSNADNDDNSNNDESVVDVNENGNGNDIYKDIKVQMFNGNTSDLTGSINPRFNIVNTGTHPVQLADVTVRYYFTVDAETTQTLQLDYVNGVSSDRVTYKFVKMNTFKNNADYYLEIGFTQNAGVLNKPNDNVEVQVSFGKTDPWNNNYTYSQYNDYSFRSSGSSYADWLKSTGYIDGVLVWGDEPSGDICPVPQGLKAVASYNMNTAKFQAALTWLQSSGAISYNIYKSTSRDGTYIKLAGSIKDISYNDIFDSVAGGTVMFYRISAVNSAGIESAYSDAAAAIWPSSPPFAVVWNKAETEPDPADNIPDSYAREMIKFAVGDNVPLSLDIAILSQIQNPVISLNLKLTQQNGTAPVDYFRLTKPGSQPWESYITAYRNGQPVSVTITGTDVIMIALKNSDGTDITFTAGDSLEIKYTLKLSADDSILVSGIKNFIDSNSLNNTKSSLSFEISECRIYNQNESSFYEYTINSANADFTADIIVTDPNLMN